MQFLRMGGEMKSIFYILGCLMMFVLGFVVDGLSTKVPREAMAVGDMIGAERVVRSYYDSKGAVPEVWSGFGVNSMTNRYGNQIEYFVTNNYYVTLRACGFGGEHSRVKNYFIRQFDVREK